MDSNLVQLAAYVIIILVIGGASVVKKMIEAKRRRQEMEKIHGKTLSLDPTYSQETERQTLTRVEEVEKEIVTEFEPDVSESKPKIEDILKELFNIPTVPQKRTPVIKNMPSKPEEKAQAFERPQMITAEVDDSALGQAETITSSNEPNWEVFATGLKDRGLTEIQRAIVMSELIQKPRASRMGR